MDGIKTIILTEIEALSEREQSVPLLTSRFQSDPSKIHIPMLGDHKHA